MNWLVMITEGVAVVVCATGLGAFGVLFIYGWLLWKNE